MDMPGRRSLAVCALLAAAAFINAPTALAAGPPAGPADDPGTIAVTTQSSVDRANDLKQQACAAAAASAKASATSVAKRAAAPRDAADCAAATENATKEAASLAGVSDGPTGPPAGWTPPADVHNPATGAVKSDNID